MNIDLEVIPINGISINGISHQPCLDVSLQLGVISKECFLLYIEEQAFWR